MIKLGNLDTMLGGYLKLSFIMAKVGNLDANLGSYFEFSFIMTDVGNLYKNIACILNYLLQWQMWVI